MTLNVRPRFLYTTALLALGGYFYGWKVALLIALSQLDIEVKK
jgi:hypothetical protein